MPFQPDRDCRRHCLVRHRFAPPERIALVERETHHAQGLVAQGLGYPPPKTVEGARQTAPEQAKLASAAAAALPEDESVAKPEAAMTRLWLEPGRKRGEPEESAEPAHRKSCH